MLGMAVVGAIAYPQLYAAIGLSVAIVGGVPVVACAWLFGFRVGVIFAVLTLPAHFAVHTILVEADPVVLVTSPGFWLGHVALVFVGAGVGRWRTLHDRLQQEVAERGRAEEAQQESEGLFATAFDQASVGMAIVGLDNRWVRANAALCIFLGYTEEELKQLTFEDVTHPDDVGLSLET